MMEALSRDIEARVEALGFELVELEQAGSKTRPILRLRIERQGSAEAAPDEANGVTLDDCTRVSRAIETYLDERTDVSERYVLEVSSPGVERPLVKRRDYERFAGREIAVRTSQPVGDRGKRVQGILRGISGDDVEIEKDRETIRVSMDNIKKAHLVYRWNEHKK